MNYVLVIPKTFLASQMAIARHIIGMLPEFRIKGTETSLDHICNEMVYANKNLVVI